MSKSLVIVSFGLSTGGTERESTTLANYLVDQGYCIKFIAVYKSKHFFTLHPSIDFVEPDFQRDSMTSFLYVLKMMLFIRKAVKCSGIKKVLSFNEWINPYVLLALSGLKVKVYVRDVMHPLAKCPFFTRVLQQHFYPKATAVIAQTFYAKNILKRNIRLLSIYVVPTQVSFINVNNVVNTKKKWISSVGRLEEVKGYSYLLKAFANLKNDGWQLHLVGEGSLKDELKALGESLGIQENLIFHGHLESFDDIFSKSEIFVLPSLKEGFPNALIEAMSVPLACISSDFHEGLSEIIDHGVNGLVFPVKDVLALTQSIQQLIDNEELRSNIKKNAFEVRKKFDLNKIGSQYISVLNR